MFSPRVRAPSLRLRRTPVTTPLATATIFAIFASLLVAQPAAAATPDPAVSDVRVGLIQLGTALAAAAEQPALSEDLPLTDTSVRNLLSLDTAIGTRVNAALLDHPNVDLNGLAGAFTDSSLRVADASSPAGAPTNSRDWLLTVKLSAARPVALTDNDKQLQFGTAALDGEVAATLDATVRFRYDPNAVELRTFYVVGSPELTTHVWTRAIGASDKVTATQVEIKPFTAIDGFVQLAAAGTANIDSTIVLKMRDPNGRGQITTEDLKFSSAADLFTTTTPPGADDVTMGINLSTSMDASATGTIVVGPRAPQATKPYAQPNIQRNPALSDMTSLTKIQAITGFTAYATAVDSLESAADQQLPLLDLSLRDVYSPAQKLLGLITEQATATISCGAADTSPPSGAPRPGQVRYCQAISGMEPDTNKKITWSAPDDSNITITAPTDGAGTLGTSPTKNVVVAGGDGFPSLRVTFTGTDGTNYAARSALTSIQSLGRTINGLGLNGQVSYDRAKGAFEIAVQQNLSTPTNTNARTGGNGNLAPLTGLNGLCQADAATVNQTRRCAQTGESAPADSGTAQTGQATVSTSGQSFSADFGIGLEEPTATDTAAAPIDPTVFIRPGVDGLVYQIKNASSTLASDAKLAARIGFLQVDVDVTNYLLEQTGGTAAAVAVSTSSVEMPRGQSTAGVVSVNKILSDDPAVAPSVTRGLSAKATLNVRDSKQADGSRPINKAGIVEAQWASLVPKALPKVATTGDYDALRLLDLVPARQSVMGEGTQGATVTHGGILVDPAADFFNQFGVTATGTEAERTITRPFYDLGIPNSTSTICSKFTVDSIHQLTCLEGPLATPATTPDGGVAPGHSYVMEGDQDALRDTLIADLAAVHSSFVSPDAALKADQTFPLVDLLPTEISVARDSLGTAISSLQENALKNLDAVSSLQNFSDTFATLLTTVTGNATDAQVGTPKLAFTLTTGVSPTLVLESSLETAGTRNAPLRAATAQQELRVIAGITGGKQTIATLPLRVGSTAKYVIDVNLKDATSAVRGDTAVTEAINGIDSTTAGSNNANLKTALAGKEAEFGSAKVTTGAAAGINVGIGVQSTIKAPGSASSWTPIAQIRGGLSQTRSVVGAPQTCGSPSPADAPYIAACLDLPLTSTSGAMAPVAVALRADQSSGGAGGSTSTQPITYRFLTDALSGLKLTLGDALDGDQLLNDSGAPTSLPLVGTDLQAGADVPGDVDKYVSAARAALTDMPAVSETDQVSVLTTALTEALTTAATAVKSNGITAIAGPIQSTCASSTDCATVAKVMKIAVSLTLKGDAPTTPVDVPFHVGPAGATIITNLTVPATTSWTLKVGVGIGRGSGPFITLAAPNAEAPLLAVTIDAKLPMYKAENCHSWKRATNWTPTGAENVTFRSLPADASTSARCIDAFVGKFPSVLVDRPDANGAARTKLHATVGVDVAPATAGDYTVYLPALYDKRVTPTTTVGGTGKVSVYFESFASTAKFFDVLGAIDQTWTPGTNDEPYGDLSFGALRVDVNTLNSALIPGFEKAKKWLAPLNPVVDTLARRIPVVSDLSEMVGQGPTTLMTLLAGSGNAKIQLILNLLQLQNLIADTPQDTPDLRAIGDPNDVLGGFKLEPLQIDQQKCTETLKDKNGNKSTRSFDGGGSSGECEPDDPAVKKQKEKDDEKLPKGTKVDKASTKSAYLSLPSVSVPVLQDTSEIFSMLASTGDATLIYVDLGHAGIGNEISKSFGPFFVGPVPVKVTLSGKAELDGRFAFGFDTRGLSKMINGLDPGDVEAFSAATPQPLLSNGFYISDLEDGVDVPEITLTFTITAGAGVSIGFASAGIQGGVILDLSLDAFDPNGDGKIYSDEFAGSQSGPTCAFNVSSGISFFLQFYFEVDFYFFSFSKTFDIVRSPRYSLFDINCDTPPEPKLAVLANNELKLTMGGYASARGGYPGQTAENYTVRQVGPPSNGTITLQVSAFDLVQNYVVPTGTTVVADAGTSADTVRMYAMPVLTTGANGQAVMLYAGDPGFVAPRFTANARVTGGDGNDTIDTSDGSDVVTGDAGNDIIKTGAGNDTITGGAGDDQLDGGEGQDIIRGGDGADRITGGAGADEVRGEDGDDNLNGGLGTDPSSIFPTTDPAAVAPQLDAGDLVVGGNGSDNVTGGDGSDAVVGGNYTQSGDFSASATVTVNGVNALNQIISFDVTGIKTLTTPSEATVKTECDSPGAAGETGSDVVSGGGDRDFIIGGSGDDTLSGGAGSDVVCGRNGNDVLEGDGDDVAASAQGADLIRGGAGQDRIYASGGNDTVYGDAGNDFVRGGTGDDTIAGGAGSDLLLGETGVNTIAGDNLASDTPVQADGADGTADARGITCSISTSVVNGRIDLKDDLSGLDNDGQLEGKKVTNGFVKDAAGNNFTGSLGGVVFTGGLADLNGSGRIETGNSTVAGDTGSIPLSGMTGAVGNGDCIIGGDTADGALEGGAGADYIDAGAGDDANVHGGPGLDLVRGGSGNDTVTGDAGNDLVAGDDGDDILYGNQGADVLRGGSGNDLLAGGSDTAGADDSADEVLGDGGDDVVLGDNARLSRTALAGTAIPGVGVTLLAAAPTQNPDDKVYGGVGNDWVFGQSGNDQAYGGPGADVVEGGPGADLVQGDDGDDLVIGGSSTTGAVTLTRTAIGVDDGNDTVVGDEGVDGDDGSDLMVGDNARLQVISGSSRTSWRRIRPDVAIDLFDVISAGASGIDTMRGGGNNDLIFGQNGNDIIAGGSGNDGIEGGTGKDTIDGEAGDDEIIGGSGTPASSDDADELTGGAGNDLLLGDNGIAIVGPDALYAKLLDVPAPGATASATVSGADTISGGTGDDRIFGQGGNDVLAGDDGLDALEGDAGIDTLTGGAGDDSLTGGSSSNDGVISPTRSGAGQLDGADILSGGLDDDVLAGDNARVDTTTDLRQDGRRLRTVRLFDLATTTQGAPTGTGGNDSMAGDEGRDLLFGQGGDDTITGNDGADALEGGAGADTLTGGAGDDALTGGSSSSDGVISPTRTGSGQLDGADTLSGGPGDDVLAGDNARLDTTMALRQDGTTLRTIQLFDLATATQSAAVGAGGNDTLAGDDGRDLLFGQRGNDVMAGGLGDDYLEGNDGADTLTGNDGEDDLVGGGSSASGAIITASGTGYIDRLLTATKTETDITSAGLLDGNDDLDGGGTRDVLLGDNGRITRDGPNKTLPGANGAQTVRQVAMADLLPGVWSGSDVLKGGDGDDDLYGQFDNSRTTRPMQLFGKEAVPGDILQGGAGDDALIGDQAITVTTPAEALGLTDRTIKDSSAFVLEVVRPRGTLIPVVTLTQSTIGGDDLILGGDGADWIHAGAGKDTVNSGAGNDAVFGGDDADALWGGGGHDRIFGGAGGDLLDIKRRTSDSKLWQLVAPTEDTDRIRRTLNGDDILSGGSGADALQADQGDTPGSPATQGDRLIDWALTINFYKVCSTLNGVGKVSNTQSTTMTAFLRDLAVALGSVGSAELAISGTDRVTDYPGTGTFICEEG